MTNQTEKCAHGGCDCPAPAGSDYCSDHCAENKDDFETGCQCGHPECHAKAVVHGQP